MDINSTTLMQAARIIAPALGLDFEYDRERVVSYVNRYREVLYNMYPDQKLFDNYTVCCCVQRFDQPCNDPCSPCDDHYLGISIPSNMAGVEAAWAYQTPLLLRSRWREVHVGLHTGEHTHLDLTEIAETTPTERQMTTPSVLSIFTNSEADEGKVVTVSGISDNGNRVKARITLGYDTMVLSEVAFRRIDSVVLPNLCGTIELSEYVTKLVLSVYYPHEHIPRYRKFKLGIGCSTKHVLVRGTRNYEDITLDDDIVEIGSRLAIEAAGRYFKYAEDTVDATEIKAGEYQYSKLEGQIKAIVERHRGRMHQDKAPARNHPSNIRGGLHVKR